MTSEKKRAFKNLKVIFIASPLASLIRFTITLLIARHLLSQGFGVYSTILSIISVFAVFIEGGRTLIVRNIAQAPERLHEIFGVTKGLLWGLSLLGFVGIMVAMRMNNDLAHLPVSTYLVAGLIAVGIYHALGHGIVFVATERMEINAIGSVACRFLTLVLVSLVVYFNLALNWILASVAVANFALWVYYRNVLQKQYGKIATVFEWRKVLDLFKQIVSVGSISIVRRIAWNVDILLLTWLVSVSQTGIFNGAYNIVFSLNMIPIFVGLAFFPMMSRMGLENRQKLLRKIRRYLVYFVLMVGPVLALFFFMADRIILLLLGDHYLATIPVMKVLAIDLIFSIPISIFLYVFIAMNLQKLFLLAVGVGLLVNVAIDLLLIPTMGAVGAAYGTLIADVFCFTILFIAQFRIRPDEATEVNHVMGAPS